MLKNGTALGRDRCHWGNDVNKSHDAACRLTHKQTILSAGESFEDCVAKYDSVDESNE